MTAQLASNSIPPEDHLNTTPIESTHVEQDDDITSNTPANTQLDLHYICILLRRKIRVDLRRKLR